MHTVQLPSKNWPAKFYKRHPELAARYQKAIDDKRANHNIFEKVQEWFEIVGPLLDRQDILQENVYNMDEMGVMLSSLASLKVFASRHDHSKHRAAPLKRETVTVIECIPANGRHLNPLVIWPAATHRSSWTAHNTPGWHYAHSLNGYTDKAISLYWIKNVFHPETSSVANGRPRVLINDGCHRIPFSKIPCCDVGTSWSLWELASWYCSCLIMEYGSNLGTL